mgnify:CR=1 FL=1
MSAKTKNAEVIRTIAAIFALALLSGCETGPVYEDHVDIPERGWYKDSVLSFTVGIEDTTVGYKILLHLRNNDDYPYRNIYFFRSVESERGTEFADTAQYLMADPYGKWLGTGVGQIKSHEWPFRESRVYFNQPGEYTFRMQQAMRTDYLEGLESVGLSVYKAENGEKE